MTKFWNLQVNFAVRDMVFGTSEMLGRAHF